MSAKLSTVWVAPQHTVAKIAMLRSYLFVWFSILGMRFVGRDLWYIDGFAGPGEYTNYSDGSPIAALKAAAQALAKTTRWQAGSIHCVFIEEDKARFGNLQQKLTNLPEHPRIQRHLHMGTFVDGLAQLRNEQTNPFTSDVPIFAFIDPFGPAGLSFNAVKDLLARPTCEVLINLDSDGISRIYSAGENANFRERLNEVFGDSGWGSELAGVQSQANAARKIVALYKRKLMALPNVRYSFAFEMRSKNDTIDYHLVFASQHPTGLAKMKEVMKRIDQDGIYSFSDGHVNQQTLFRYDDPATHAQQMRTYFGSQTVAYGVINDYALNESPFANPKAMLKLLEINHQISVSSPRARRVGTFPDDAQHGMNIQFLG